jgi:hypothetical protein
MIITHTPIITQPNHQISIITSHSQCTHCTLLQFKLLLFILLTQIPNKQITITPPRIYQILINRTILYTITLPQHSSFLPINLNTLLLLMRLKLHNTLMIKPPRLPHCQTYHIHPPIHSPSHQSYTLVSLTRIHLYI